MFSFLVLEPYLIERTGVQFEATTITIVHGGGGLAGRPGDDRGDHVVVVFKINEGRGVPARRYVRYRSLRRHWPRHRHGRREKGEIRGRYDPGHRAYSWVREDLLQRDKHAFLECPKLARGLVGKVIRRKVVYSRQYYFPELGPHLH